MPHGSLTSFFFGYASFTNLTANYKILLPTSIGRFRQDRCLVHHKLIETSVEDFQSEVAAIKSKATGGNNLLTGTYADLPASHKSDVEPSQSALLQNSSELNDNALPMKILLPVIKRSSLCSPSKESIF